MHVIIMYTNYVTTAGHSVENMYSYWLSICTHCACMHTTFLNDQISCARRLDVYISERCG